MPGTEPDRTCLSTVSRTSFIDVTVARYRTAAAAGGTGRDTALVVGGAGAAYISGGSFGLGELAFTTLMVAVAYAGLRSWTFIDIGWLLHTAWDVLHHRRGDPLIPSVHDSSSGCALCDPVIALWCLTGGRTPAELLRSLRKA